jgi:hypothetical protein
LNIANVLSRGIVSHGARSNLFGRTSGIARVVATGWIAVQARKTNEGTLLPDFKRSVIRHSDDKAAASPTLAISWFWLLPLVLLIIGLNDEFFNDASASRVRVPSGRNDDDFILARAQALVAGGAACSPRLEGWTTRGNAWFETAQVRLLTMKAAYSTSQNMQAGRSVLPLAL